MDWTMIGYGVLYVVLMGGGMYASFRLLMRL